MEALVLIEYFVTIVYGKNKCPKTITLLLHLHWHFQSIKVTLLLPTTNSLKFKIYRCYCHHGTSAILYSFVPSTTSYQLQRETV